MPRPRTPKAKLIASGQTLNHPSRYARRSEPRSRPLGGPPKYLKASECDAWQMFTKELPWLNESHRALLEIASTARARFTSGEDVEIRWMNLLRLCLGAMGATPADASKVSVTDDDEDDPSDKYFDD